MSTIATAMTIAIAVMLIGSGMVKADGLPSAVKSGAHLEWSGDLR